MEQLPDLLKKMQDVAIWTARWPHRVLSVFVGRRGMLLYRLYLNLRLFPQLTKRRIKGREHDQRAKARRFAAVTSLGMSHNHNPGSQPLRIAEERQENAPSLIDFSATSPSLSRIISRHMRELRGVKRITGEKDSRQLESRLMFDAASGDVEAFSDIYRRYRDRVYGFIYRMTPAGATAEDLTHDVFLALLEHPAQYDPAKGSLLTFLCAIARCRVVDQMRKNGTRAEKELWTDEGHVLPAAGEASITPFDRLLKVEIEDLVDKAVMALPPLQREVLLLRENEGLSYEEIATVVGGSVGVVKARLYRARQQLAARLGPLIRTNGDEEYELRKSRA